MGWRTLLKWAAWRGERLHRSVLEESLTILKELQTGREGWTLMYVRTFPPCVICNLGRLFFCVCFCTNETSEVQDRETLPGGFYMDWRKTNTGMFERERNIGGLIFHKTDCLWQEMKRFQTRCPVSGYGGYLEINTVAMVIHSLVISLYPLAFGMKTFLNKSPSRTTFSEWSPDSCLCVRLKLKQKNVSPTRTLTADISGVQGGIESNKIIIKLQN